MAKRKSFIDLGDQLYRIGVLDNFGARWERAEKALQRYANNIEKTPSFNRLVSVDGGYTAYNRKYSRRTYMGLSQT